MLPLSIVSGLQILSSFLVQWLTLTKLGAGAETDALAAAVTLPQAVLGALAGSMGYVLVPLFANRPEESLGALGWTLLAGVGATALGLALLLQATAALWVPAIVPGLSPATIVLTVDLARIVCMAIPGTACLTVLVSVHNARHRFIGPALVQLGATLAVVVVLTLGLELLGVRLAAWAVVVLPGISAAVLLPHLGSPRLTAESLWPDVIKRMRPLVLAGGYCKLDALIDSYLVSHAAQGALTIFTLAQRMTAAALQVTSQAVTRPMVPELARLAGAGSWPAFRRRYIRAMTVIVAASLLFCVVLALAGLPALSMVLARGSFDHRDVGELWELLPYFVAFLIASALGDIVANAHYSRGDTSTPSKIGALGFTIGAPLKVAGFLFFGLKGLILASAGYYMLNAVAMEIALRRRSQS